MGSLRAARQTRTPPGSRELGASTATTPGPPGHSSAPTHGPFTTSILLSISHALNYFINNWCRHRKDTKAQSRSGIHLRSQLAGSGARTSHRAAQPAPEGWDHCLSLPQPLKGCRGGRQWPSSPWSSCIRLEHHSPSKRSAE